MGFVASGKSPSLDPFLFSLFPVEPASAGARLQPRPTPTPGAKRRLTPRPAGTLPQGLRRARVAVRRPGTQAARQASDPEVKQHTRQNHDPGQFRLSRTGVCDAGPVHIPEATKPIVVVPVARRIVVAVGGAQVPRIVVEGTPAQFQIVCPPLEDRSIPPPDEAAQHALP